MLSRISGVASVALGVALIIRPDFLHLTGGLMA
jgi:hypothetical protein